MSLRLRRSARAKPISAFNVGDTIEYKRRSKTGQGTLSFRLTEGESPNPLWLVTVDGASSSAKDEEIYEKHFIRLVEKAVLGRPKEKVEGGRKRVARMGRGGSADEGNENEDAATDGAEGPADLPQDAIDKVHETSQSVSSSDADGSSASGGSRAKRAKRTGSGTDQQQLQLQLQSQSSTGSDDKEASSGGPEEAAIEDDSGAHSDSSSRSGGTRGGRANRAAARAARSLRRQAKIEKTTPLATVPAQATWAGAVAGTNAAPVPASPESLKRIHATAEDEVVKVKLNTGTLYLYKGFIRRAVFVRRY